MNIYMLSVIYSQFGNIQNEIGRGIARKYASPRWRAVTNRLLNANPAGPQERRGLLHRYARGWLASKRRRRGAGRRVLGTAVEVGLTPKSGHMAGVSTVAPERVLLWICGRGSWRRRLGGLVECNAGGRSGGVLAA